MHLLRRRVIRKLGRGQSLDFFEVLLRRSVHVPSLHLFSGAVQRSRLVVPALSSGSRTGPVLFAAVKSHSEAARVANLVMNRMTES